MTATRETLTTGWERDVAISDTLLRRYLLHYAEACDAFARACGGAVVDEGRWRGADSRRPMGFQNSAVLLAPPGPDPTGLLDEIEAFFAPGRGKAMVWSPWPLGHAARGRWELSGHPPLLARPPATTAPPPDPPALHLERVSDDTGVLEWETTAVEAYPFTELADEPSGRMLPAGLLGDERFTFFTSREGGTAVAVSALFREHGISSLFLGATRPEARGRGHWRRHAVERLRRAGDDWVLSVLSDFSRGPGEALGFVPLVRLDLWVIERPS